MEFLNQIRLHSPWLFGMGLNTVLLGIVSLSPKKLLTLGGILNAWLLGVLIWGSLDWQGYSIVAFYFIVGSGVTRIKMAEKEAEGIAENRSGARGAENVWGSALVGAICALALLVIKNSEFQSLFVLGYVASFSTKLSDTTASEVGKAYGKRTFLMTTFQPVPRGTEGAVSLEGTVAGIVASLVIALVGWALGLITGIGIIWCAIASLIATTIESVIGASIQEDLEWLTNELVNIINTFIGAIVAIALAYFWY